MRVSASRGSVLCLSLAAAMALPAISRGLADDELKDPFLGQEDAIAAGRVTYAGKCYVCHHSSGARGPNLFATKLSDQRFLETVIQGRKGTQMPAFGLRCRRRLDRKRPGVRQFCGGNERPDGWFLPLSAVKLGLILQRSTEVAADSIRARKESRRAPILWRTQRS